MNYLGYRALRIAYRAVQRLLRWLVWSAMLLVCPWGLFVSGRDLLHGQYWAIPAFGIYLFVVAALYRLSTVRVRMWRHSEEEVQSGFDKLFH